MHIKLMENELFYKFKGLNRNLPSNIDTNLEKKSFIDLANELLGLFEFYFDRSITLLLKMFLAQT